MDQSEVPDLATLLTQSEDSVETLALAKTFASDDDEVNLNELVDLISTTIGGAAPILPLREERMSLGVECVFNAKGVAWNLAKQNRNKISSSEKTLEMIEVAISKFKELDCSGEGNHDSRTRNQNSKRKQLSGMTYPEYLNHLAKCQAKTKHGIVKEHNEFNDETDMDEEMAGTNNKNSKVNRNMDSDFLSPEYTRWVVSEEAVANSSNNDLAEGVHALETKSDIDRNMTSGLSSSDLTASAIEINVEGIHERAAAATPSNDLAEGVHALETKSDIDRNMTSGLSSSDLTESTKEINVEQIHEKSGDVTSSNDLAEGVHALETKTDIDRNMTRGLSSSDLTASAIEINVEGIHERAAAATPSNDVAGLCNDNIPNERCYSDDNSKIYPLENTSTGSPLNADSTSRSESELLLVTRDPEARLDSYEHLLTDFSSPDNYVSPFKGIKNSIPFSPFITDPRLQVMKRHDNESEKSLAACAEEHFVISNTCSNRSSKIIAQTTVVRETNRRSRSSEICNTSLDNNGLVIQPKEQNENESGSLNVNFNEQGERVDQASLITELMLSANQMVDSRDDVEIKQTYHEEEEEEFTQQQSQKFQHDVEKHYFAKKLLEETVQNSRFHSSIHLNETISNISSDAPLQNHSFKDILEDRLFKGRAKRRKSYQLHRRPPLSSSGVKNSSNVILGEKMLIENGFCNGISGEIRRSLSMRSNATNESTSSVLSTEDVQQSIQYTYSALCRINASLDDAEVMSVDSEESGDYDALFFAKESKNEIAALARAIELQIAQERCGHSVGSEASERIMSSTSYDTVISRDTTCSRASINQLIHDVNVLCNQIENKVDNIVKDTIQHSSHHKHSEF